MKYFFATLLLTTGTAALGGQPCERVAVEHEGSVLYYGFRNVPSGGCGKSYNRRDRDNARAEHDDQEDDIAAQPAADVVVAPTVAAQIAPATSPVQRSYRNISGIRNRAYVRH